MSRAGSLHAFRTSRSSAFSLFEVLLGLTIFSVALVGTMQAITIQIRAEQQAEDVTRATILAQNVLEEVRQAGEFEDEDSDSGDFDGPDAAFKWTYRMEETEVQDLYRVTVTVSWQDGLAMKDYGTETYLADRGGSDAL